MNLVARWGVFLSPTWVCSPGASYRSIHAWDGVEERFRKRLGMWKRQYISKGGGATLIKAYCLVCQFIL